MQVAQVAIVIINGLELGLLYALIALGFSLIYGVGRIMFCTHGEIYMLGALAAWFLIENVGLPFGLVLLLVLLGSGVVGLIFDRFLRPLYTNTFAVFVITLSLATVISSTSLELFGGQSLGVKEPLTGFVSLMGISLPIMKLVVALISALLIVALHFFFSRVKAGQAIRAMAQNPEGAALQGIDKNRTVSLTFFLALATAGIAGVLMLPIYFVDASMGGSALLTTFIVVILGGIGSFPGAIAGGLFVGMLRSVGGLFMSGQITYLISFVVVVVFLVVRPRGFFGHE